MIMMLKNQLIFIQQYVKDVSEIVANNGKH